MISASSASSSAFLSAAAFASANAFASAASFASVAAFSANALAAAAAAAATWGSTVGVGSGVGATYVEPPPSEFDGGVGATTTGLARMITGSLVILVVIDPLLVAVPRITIDEPVIA